MTEQKPHAFVLAVVDNPKAAWDAVTALEDSGNHDQAQKLKAEIIAAGGSVPDGTQFVPDSTAGLK